ncbi:UNVERIFIED_ORG: hypothetical protein J3D58_003602 [Paenarthrobacter nicotinovorans]
MKEITIEELSYVVALEPGDAVTATALDGNQVAGKVDIAAKGYVWIYTPYGERKLLHIREHTFDLPPLSGGHAPKSVKL